VLFLVIGGTSRGSSRLGNYSLMKLEAPKNGQEDPNWLQIINERVKWLQQEISRIPKIKERSYLEKV
jgi:hypothetical protein